MNAATSITRTISCAALAFSLTLTGLRPAQAQTLFTRPNLPLGIATDRNGNVWVQTDRTWDQGLAVYRSNGSYLGYVKLGGLTEAQGAGHFALVPSSGLFLHLAQTGRIRIIDPSTGSVRDWLDLRRVNVDTSSIYDIAQRRFWNFGGMIVPSLSSYGDIAVLQRSGRTDIFITGLSAAQTFPFVLRIRLTSTGSSVKVVAASSASTGGSYNGERGVAANAQGLVLTTLPYQTGAGSYDRAVAFSADFPETRTGLPTIKLNGVDMPSRGITTNAAGNFYIATGTLGTSLAGTGASGALVVLSPDAGRVLGIGRLGIGLADSRDVALSPDGKRIYMTVYNRNAVVAW